MSCGHLTGPRPALARETCEDAYARRVARLNKFDVEALMNSYDADATAALTIALRKVLDRPDADWPTLIGVAPFDTARRAALLAADQSAFDELVQELNELRAL